MCLSPSVSGRTARFVKGFSVGKIIFGFLEEENRKKPTKWQENNILLSVGYMFSRPIS